jgi:hypothetical protein
VSLVRDDDAAELGERLRLAGFQPLPEVGVRGELLGTRLWRLRAGYVEYVALRSNGVGHAVRAEAHYDYRRPFDHGPVVGNHIDYVTAAVDWLLESAPGPEPEADPDVNRVQPHPYLDPPPRPFDWLGDEQEGPR